MSTIPPLSGQHMPDCSDTQQKTPCLLAHETAEVEWDNLEPYRSAASSIRWNTGPLPARDTAGASATKRDFKYVSSAVKPSLIVDS